MYYISSITIYCITACVCECTHMYLCRSTHMFRDQKSSSCVLPIHSPPIPLTKLLLEPGAYDFSAWLGVSKAQQSCSSHFRTEASSLCQTPGLLQECWDTNTTSHDCSVSAVNLNLFTIFPTYNIIVFQNLPWGV